MLKEIRKKIRRWWECRTKRCDYYRHYLAYGPAELTHEGYHAACVKCETAQLRDMRWMDEHPYGDSPWRRQCEYWEKVVRA